MTTVTTKGHTMKHIKTQAIIIDPSNYSHQLSLSPDRFIDVERIDN